MLYLTTTLVRSTTRHGWSLLGYGFQCQLGCLTFSRDATLHQNALKSSELCCLQTVCTLLGILSNAGQWCYQASKYFTDTGNPSKASLTFDKRFTAMWPDTNSNRGIVNPFFANLALDATSPWLTPFSCTTTVYTAAATPFPLASPKVCNRIGWMSSWCAANDRGTVTWLGSLSSQWTQLCIKLLGS